jgi:hypothetical protein
MLDVKVRRPSKVSLKKTDGLGTKKQRKEIKDVKRSDKLMQK